MNKVHCLESFKDNLVFKLSHSVKITYSLYTAFELNLFDLIAENEPISLSQISEKTQLPKRSASALTSMCASMGLLEVDGEHKFSLSEISQSFLDRDSPYYLGHLFDIHLENKGVILSYEAFREAIITGKAQVYDGHDLFKTNESEQDKTIKFTKAMHAKSQAAAEFWPNVVDFNTASLFLDIGGGSGVHSIAAAKNWSNLKAIVFERPEVCEIASEFIEQEKLSSRISPVPGDMWCDSYPKADIHFLCDILHDWPMRQVEFLLEKSFAFLDNNGQIVIHELLFDEKKDGPLSVSMSNLSMLMWTEGQQLSKDELFFLMEKVGFVDIKFSNTGFGDWCIVTGRKIH